jgi:Domain of unknown function (DUF4136)
MRIFHALAGIALALSLSACSGIDTEPAEIEQFAAGNYQFYAWRTEPLQNKSNSRDPIYMMDKLIRASVDEELRSKGYRLNADKAQFNIEYLSAAGTRQGVENDQVSNISTRPRALGRDVDQATIDNAHALAGVVDTQKLALIMRDVNDGSDIWHVVITKIIEDANYSDKDRMRKNISKAVKQGLKTLPEAS